ncbi:TetR/AcrR family transcriptional regulator [Caldimicrobium thiodismutans]|nr:TetR/AcrR family transcriptional regulator [Caldimicrobium thiodismutans]
MDTKERILEAALLLFSEKGYLGATTKEISRTAKISEVTLFRHFQTKENLFINVIEHYSFLPKLKELLPELKDYPLEDSLKTLARTFLESLRIKKALIRIMLSEFPRYPEIIKKSYQKTIENIHNELSQYFQKIQKKGLIKETLSSYLLSQAFLGLFFSYFHAKEIKGLNFRESLADDEIIEHYVEIFLKGIKKESPLKET